jgi:hypothetical protein
MFAAWRERGHVDVESATDFLAHLDKAGVPVVAQEYVGA